MAPDYPIIVGVGQITNHSVDAQTAKEPLELMEIASRRAEADAATRRFAAFLAAFTFPNLGAQHPWSSVHRDRGCHQIRRHDSGSGSNGA